MPRAPPLTAALALTLLFLFFLTSTTTTTDAHNITRILAKHPEFSTFNHYLTVTRLAAEINRRQTITVLALNNAAMSSLLSEHFSVYTLRNVLSLHVLVDYFGTKKLHQITKGSTLTSTMFQATGAALGTSGYVNITDTKGGKVAFGPEDNGGKLNSLYVKSLVEIPYNISVLQVSQALNSTEAEAPSAAPSLNLTVIMSKQGCKGFSDLLIATGARRTFEANLEGGLTVFCPPDTVLNDFMPRYKTLTEPQKLSLLLFHGIPVYESVQMLKSNNGLMNTLATDGANKFDFKVQTDREDVTLETKASTAKITGTVKDEEPLVVYTINKVLLPGELFKAAPAAAAAPKASTGTQEADAPADEDPADQTADSTNGVSRMNGGRLIMATWSLCLGGLVFL